MERCVLVPYEFSNEANFALNHAYEIAKYEKLPIHILYVAESDKMIDEWQAELEKVAERFVKETGYENVKTIVKKGSPFDVIHEYGIEQNAYLAVMGVHGIKTIEKQVKLIQKFEKVPFVLVQSPLAFGEYDRICIPIDWDKKSRAKFMWAKYLNLIFESHVYVVYPKTNSESRQAEINSNLAFATTLFADNAIEFDVEGVPEDDFYENIYDYMRGISPDLVLYMSENYKKAFTSIRHPRNIELSKKIPVMCVNPRTDIVKLGGFNY
ncbi:MAG: universal stress protein [Bacteroidales bacterium]|nr:universal stress protein [Bacteroidales bacterium]